MSPMHSLIRIVSVSLLVLFCLHPMAQAQPGNSVKIDIKRQLFHEYIDREQKNVLKADGKADNFFKAGNDEEVNFLVTQALTKKVDELQLKIERDTALVHNTKVTYLRGIEMMLKNFTGKVRTKKINPSLWPQILNTYEQAIFLDSKKESIESLVDKNHYDVGYVVLATYDGSKSAFDKNRGYAKSRQLLLLKFLNAHPDEILPQLKNNFDVPFRDSLIIVAAYKNPMRLYDYASANNQLGIAIRSVNDPLVKTISKMATSDGSGQMYFPFLDNIIDGKTTIAEIDAVKNDNVKYYKLLVKTRIDYVNRTLEKKTIYGMGALEDRLKEKAKNVFIKEINGLHEEPDAVRFRILQQLTAQELYYLIVFSDDELYTSSYTKGVYPAVMAKSGNRGDSLLMTVGFDRFKKFIKLAAGYNTLNEFLKSFPSDDLAKSLMQGFVNNLERSVGLEDGVDVADSYTSIMEHNKPLADYVLNLTKINLDKNQAANNHRGTVMYNLLYKLFLSADTTNNVNLSKEFGIPPVYDVKYNTLADSKGRVVMHVFFYGDKDGKINYQNFMPQFYRNANWTVSENKQWVTISAKNKPFIIYANKPLPEETNQDSEAQQALEEFLDKNEISPSIVVHRGHSYYAETTIEHIKPTAKVVYLGSCGGYHLLHEVLRRSDDAHIIASKQIGKGVINEPFMRLLIEKIRMGNDLEWIPFWNEFKRAAGSVEGFDDYIPPHKNLGAIFIKAYKSQMGDEDGNQL